ncbi:unnamed protein product [Rotaria socialis]|uniref:Uncharacterized protein n=1 Tax=Rotaria socialis TaxID=392032 RepID=A0A818FFF7_9BILA|nr:unnamed protein product [Rotaria socialis]
MRKIMNKAKVMSWYQWTTVGGRVLTRIISFKGTVIQCVKQLQRKTPQYLWDVFVKRKQSGYFDHIKENADDTTVVCQVDYTESYTLQDQDQIQSAHWSKKQVSIFTAYIWMGGSGWDGYSFGFVSNLKKHDKFTVITYLEILIQEIIALMPDVDQIIFFRMVLPLLFVIIWQGVVDSINGTLKRFVWMGVMAGARCSSAKEFVNICRRKTKTILVALVQQAQFDTTEALLKTYFQNIVGVPNIRKQHHINVLNKDVIECALYATCKDKYVFKF